MNSYNKGRRWAWAVFNSAVSNYGELGIRKCDKASRTCNKIAQSGKKNGKRLLKSDLAFYRGAVVGFQEYYNKKIN